MPSTAERRFTARVWGVALAALALVGCAGVARVASSPVLDAADARHLLARTGFAPTAAEVAAYTGKSRAQAVEALLATVRTQASTPLPALLADAAWQIPPGPEATPEERKAFVREQVQQGIALRAWWIGEMVDTPSPLAERMTLFWHNHFVSAQPKVRITSLMLRQNQTLRANALGNFGTLLHAIAKDPAMIVYLDGVRNRRGAPNENFAREVMELFTLGEGRYTEQDVKEAARAFTGWSIDRRTGAFVFRPALHDDGLKTVLGHTGRFDGDDVLDLLLARPETAVHVTEKLWRELVSPDPDPTEVAHIADAFRASHYEIKTLLRAMLASDAFYAPANRGVLVKSPAELVVGTLRELGVDPRDAVPLARATTAMGQNLFSAPNVKGWPGGDVWINTTTLLAREQFLDRVTRGRIALAGAEPASLDADAPARNRTAQAVLLATAPVNAPPGDADPTTFVRALLLDPAYQLK